MKIEKITIANSLALTTAIIWILCSLIVVILPGFSLTATKWMLHGLNIKVLGTWSMTIGNFTLGGITLAVSAWIGGYIFVLVWEALSKK